MKNLIKPILYFSFTAFITLSCNKAEKVYNPSFSEKLVGEWERPESVNLIMFGNLEFNENTLPYDVLTINLDSTYRYKRSKFDEDEVGTYDVSEIDSLVTFTSQWRYGWKILECKDDIMTVSFGEGREGPRLDRFVKIK